MQLQRPPLEVNLIFYIGLILWGMGFLFEVIGDWQLSAFITQPENRGKVMSQGLWSYTRHPNYFGEVLMWWSLYIMIVSVNAQYWTIISPLCITWLLLKVSGVPMAEEQMKKLEGFPEYKRRTSIFFPLNQGRKKEGEICRLLGRVNIIW